MASYDTGYEDERFQHPVGQSFHCGICYNVVKDPTMCRHNEHLFCRACITRSLVNSQKCPSCVEPLTVETLAQPSRTVMNLLSELKIRCQFFNRGCEKFIELGNLDGHVQDCGFAPAVCSNEECRVEVNKQDLLHHETAVCELRRVQCHSCNDIRQEMEIVKDNLAAMNVKLMEVGEKLDRNEKQWDDNQENLNAVKDDVIAKVQEQLNKQEESIHQLKGDVKISFDKVTKQLQGTAQQTSHKVQAAQEHGKIGIAEAGGVDREPKVVVAGGWDGGRDLNSVEIFSLSNATWKPLQRMINARFLPSSFVHNNQIFVSGGLIGALGLKSVENISINAVGVDESSMWKIIPAELPTPLYGHCCVVYNGRLLVVGGYDDRQCSNRITEVSLVPPHTCKVLTTMPQRRFLHCVLLFGDKIAIFGGKERFESSATHASVLMYDIARNKFAELAPLPYPVANMAAVKWGDDNVIITGGEDENEKSLNKVLIYNIKTQKSHMLPEMKYEREGCVAAVVRDTVIVIGGRDEKGNCLKSVESFRFDRFTWEELPEMDEARYASTAVAC